MPSRLSRVVRYQSDEPVRSVAALREQAAIDDEQRNLQLFIVYRES